MSSSADSSSSSFTTAELRGFFALRTAYKRDQFASIRRDEKNIHINGESFPGESRTPVRYGKEYYNLDTIYYFINSVVTKQKASEYVSQCSRLKVASVRFSDRTALTEYLNGDSEVAPIVDLPAGVAEHFLKTLSSQSSSVKEAHSSSSSHSSSQSLTSSSSQSLSQSHSLTASSSASMEVEGAPAIKRVKYDPFSLVVPPAKPVDTWTVEDVLAEERPLATRITVLQNPKKDFSAAIQKFNDAVAATEQAAKEKAHDKSSQSSSSSSNIPIIVVPAALSSVITMYNVKEFLEHGVYRPSADYDGKPKPTMVQVSRKSHYDPSRTVVWHVIDDVSKLKPAEWDRVVAVFVHGPTWQFSNWPSNRWATPAAIFESVCAFHVHWEGEQLSDNIQKWRTNRLALSKSKEYQHRAVVIEFWHTLTNTCAARASMKTLAI